LIPASLVLVGGWVTCAVVIPQISVIAPQDWIQLP
jgi:hypothetical protein